MSQWKPVILIQCISYMGSQQYANKLYCPVLITSFRGFVWPMHLTEFYLNNNWIHDTETYRKVLQNIQCQSMTYLLKFGETVVMIVQLFSKIWQQLVMACSELP